MDEYLLEAVWPRNVAVQVAGDPAPFAGVGADRVYVGVRGCCELFLELCARGTVRKWLKSATSVGSHCGLVTPLLVPERYFDAVVSAVADHADVLDRVMIGDLGVAAALKGSVRVSWCGRVLNAGHAEYLRSLGIDGVRSLSPVSAGVMDINHTVDVEIPAFGRIPLSFSPVCLLKMMDRGFDCPTGCVEGLSSGAEPVTLSCAGGSVRVMPGFLESTDFIDLSGQMKSFGRDTCAVIETSGLSATEVAEAVDALRRGRAVYTGRPLFVSE